MPTAPTTEPQKAGPRTAPLDLWRIAQNFLATLHMLFAGPGDVARQHTLTREAHTLMLSWLRAGEALMRRLLLIEAAAFSQLPAIRPRAPRQRVRKLMSFSPDDPDSWRVSFRLMERGRPRPRPSANTRARAPALHTRFLSAWPLAERFEALIRVFNEPARYARRLARRLQADPRAASRVLAAPKQAANLIGFEAFTRLEHASLHAAPCANTS